MESVTRWASTLERREENLQFNTRDKELTLKIVYYGPALSGKTTNIQALHHYLNPGVRGRLMVVNTKGDRTLFFDLLPVHFVTESGYHIKLKVFTVPGQVMHESTRRIVLSGCDAICFIADGQRDQRAQNNEAFSGMLQNLKANKIDRFRVPIVIQFNKMDLPNTLSQQDLDDYRQRGKEPIYPASAIRGEGVVESLRGCLSLMWESLERQHDFHRIMGISQQEFMSGVFRSLGGGP